MNKRFDLSQLEWKLSGWAPNVWRCCRNVEIGASPLADVKLIPALVPGSVQLSLLQAGIIQNWNENFNSRDCEWVENRHWVYETEIPDEWLEEDCLFSIECLGLDYSGWILINGVEVSEFSNAFVPHSFNVTAYLNESENVLQIVFDCPPRWLGYCGATSKMTQWKPRFNYTWDWTARIVQLGIWDSIWLHSRSGPEISSFSCVTDVNMQNSTGWIRVQGSVAAVSSERIRLTLASEGNKIWSSDFSISQFEAGIEICDLPVELWWPNLLGKHQLYTLHCELLNSDGVIVDKTYRRVGFKNITWRQCKGSPEHSDPWICVVNGEPMFLQGINWTPIRPNFADVTEEDYRKSLEIYHDIGCNILRVWGGSMLEKECFYNLCDEFGLMIWQEFPLSSSWIEDWPPEDEISIDEMARIAESYIARRQHHVSLALWCGGNELQGSLDGTKAGTGKPVDLSHPMILRLREIVSKLDPLHRFLSASASGPREFGDAQDYGKHLHWDVHGPWNAVGAIETEWTDYWLGDDALFRSEVGNPGASSVNIIRAHFPGILSIPLSSADPFVEFPCCSWTQWTQYIEENGGKTPSLADYVAWSQNRQAQTLSIAARSCKDRFPSCGGIIIWMGHDSFPCIENTSIVDFYGNPKPVAYAIKTVFCEVRKETA